MFHFHSRSALARKVTRRSANRLNVESLEHRALPSYTYVSFDVPGGVNARAAGINDFGQIVGYNYTSASESSGSGRGFFRDGSAATQTTIFNANFENPVGSEWSSTIRSTTPGTAAHPADMFLGEFGNKTVSLNLNNLAPHTQVRLKFDLFLIRTWDGNGFGGDGPDNFNVKVTGGPTLLNTNFGNSPDTAHRQAYPNMLPPEGPGGAFPLQTGATEVNTLGFLVGPNPIDSVYKFDYSFPSSASALEFNFQGAPNEGIANESWGLNNVEVSIDVAPQPEGSNSLPLHATSLNAVETLAEGINNTGLIVGNYRTSTSGPSHGFLLSNGTYTEITVPDAPDVDAVGINASGQIVGTAAFAGNQGRGFVKTENSYEILHASSLGATQTTSAYGINDAGDVVGAYADPTAGAYGFLRNSSGYSKIDFPDDQPPSPNDYTSAFDINSAGDIVGQYRDQSKNAFRGFVKRGTVYEPIDPPGSVYTVAYGINNAGDIVGNYQDASGNKHAFLAIDDSPRVSSVTSPSSNGAYFTGQSVSVTLNFNHPLTLSGGNFLVTLDTGAVLTVVPFSGTSATATYVIQAGQTSVDLTVTSLNLASGATLTDGLGTNALLILPTSNLAATANLIVNPLAPTTVSAVAVNVGATQRSRLTQLTLNFSTPVNVAKIAAPGAIALTRTRATEQGSVGTFVQTGPTALNSSVLVSPASGIVSSVTLTFFNFNSAATSAGVESDSLADGRWRLTIPYLNYASAFSDPALRRLFGDSNSDGTVDGTDFAQFGANFGQTVVNSPFDFNNDGTIDGIDFAEFGGRFGLTL